MLLLVVPGSVGSTVRLVDLDFGVLVGVPRGAEARSDLPNSLVSVHLAVRGLSSAVVLFLCFSPSRLTSTTLGFPALSFALAMLSGWLLALASATCFRPRTAVSPCPARVLSLLASQD